VFSIKIFTPGIGSPFLVYTVPEMMVYAIVINAKRKMKIVKIVFMACCNF